MRARVNIFSSFPIIKIIGFSSSAFLLILLCLYSCKKEAKYPGYTETPSGLFYKLQSFGEGNRKPKAGEFLDVHISYHTCKDSFFLDSGYDNELNRLIIPFTNSSFKGSFEEHFANMTEGDSISCIVKADSIFDRFLGVPFPLFIKRGEMLHVNVKLKKVLTEVDRMKALNHYQELLDDLEIEEQRQTAVYIENNHITVPPINEGLYYLPIKEGEGANVEDGKVVYINYRGYFLNGKMFDSNNGKLPFDFTMGDQDQVIKGIEIGLRYMKEGGKAKFIIPSLLAFGDMGSSAKIVPPYSAVIYEVELVKVK